MAVSWPPDHTPAAAEELTRRHGDHSGKTELSAEEVQKCRPCVVVSPDIMYPSGMAVVCPCSTSLHKTWPYRIQVNFNGRDDEIMADQIRAVSLNHPENGCNRSRRSSVRRYRPDFSAK